jgi:glutathione S-transferase
VHKLYYSPGACSLAVHIVLEEIGLPYELELVLSSGESEGAMTSSQWWRRMNPKGRIPALSNVSGRIGGAEDLLTETHAILVYLALAHPSAQLLPAHCASQARCVEWMNWMASNVHAMSFGQIWRPGRFSDDTASHPAIRAKGLANLRSQYRYMEELLSDGREWAEPSGYSVVDPYLLVFYLWGHRVGFDMVRAYPCYAALIARLLERPAVARALRSEQITAP